MRQPPILRRASICRSKSTTADTGQLEFDVSSSYGSAGRLLGVNVLDAYDRGILSNNATHEIVHSGLPLSTRAWESTRTPRTTNLAAARRVSSGASSGRTTAPAPSPWTVARAGMGAFMRPPLDRYMMGLIDASAVPPLQVNDDIDFGTDCGTVVASMLEVTIDDIIAAEGPRLPGPRDGKARLQHGLRRGEPRTLAHGRRK